MAIRMILSLALAALVAAGCSQTPSDSGGFTVITTTSVLGDIARNVVGATGVVEVLMPIGADPHSFQATVRQAAAMRDADLVIANGLHLEAALDDLLETVASDGGRVLEVGPLVDPLPFGRGSDTLDPHVWLDPGRGRRIAEAIADELATLAPSLGTEIRSNLSEYTATLGRVEAEIASALAVIENRRLVTYHDSLGYLARRYDLEIVGTIIRSGSSVTGPSARDLADLVDIIEEYDVAAIISESSGPSRLADVVAEEADRPIAVVELYTGSLGPGGSGAETYTGMLMLNATRLAEALR